MGFAIKIIKVSYSENVTGVGYFWLLDPHKFIIGIRADTSSMEKSLVYIYDSIILPLVILLVVHPVRG